MSETVWVTGHKSGGKRKFHPDPDCRYVTDSHEEWDRELAEAWFDKCDNCDSDTFDFGGYSEDY